MKLIVGLGNPGEKYADTRHNIGFDIADVLAVRAGASFRKPWLSHGHTATVRVGDDAVLVLKPSTYMNDSGRAVGPLAKKKKIPAEDVLVVFDDVDLDCGTIKLRTKGGAGGHNGMKSVIQHLGTDEFPRLRVGVGPRPRGEKLVNYVLARWHKSQRDDVDEMCQTGADAIELFVRKGIDAAMNRYN